MPAEIGDTLNTSRPCEWRSFLMQNGGSLEKLTAAAVHRSSRGWSIFSEHLNGERTRLVLSVGRARALSPDDQFNQVTLERSSASWVLGLADAPIMICDDRPTPSPNSSGGTSRPQPTQSRMAAKALSKKKVVSNAKARKSGGGSVKPGVPTSAERVALDSDADFFASLAPSTGATSQDPRDLLRRLRAYLEPPRDLPETVSLSMWTAFVESVFRIVVLRVPALATLALSPITVVAAEEAAIKPCGCSAVVIAGACSEQPLQPAPAPSSVRAFLDLLTDRLGRDDRTEGNSAVVALWQALKYAQNKSDKGESCEQNGLIDVGVLTEAIDTMLLEEEAPTESGDSMVLLGGRVWKEIHTATWTRAHWDLFYQLVSPKVIRRRLRNSELTQDESE